MSDYVGDVDLEMLISSVSTRLLGHMMSQRFVGREYAIMQLVISM